MLFGVGSLPVVPVSRVCRQQSNDFPIQFLIGLGHWCIFCNGVAHAHEMASPCHTQKRPESRALENFFLKPLLLFLVNRHLILPVEFGCDEPIIIESPSSLFYNIPNPRVMRTNRGRSCGCTSQCVACFTTSWIRIVTVTFQMLLSFWATDLDVLHVLIGVIKVLLFWPCSCPHRLALR